MSLHRHVHTSVVRIAPSIKGVSRAAKPRKKQTEPKPNGLDNSHGHEPASPTSPVIDFDPSRQQQSHRRVGRNGSSILEFPSPYASSSSSASGSKVQLLETETDPRKFIHRLDLTEELTNNAASYQTWDEERESIDVYGWNNLVTDYLEKIRSRVAANRLRLDRSYANPGRNSKPGLDPSISCCIHNGATTLLHHVSVIRINKIREIARSISGVGSGVGQMSRHHWTVFKSLAGEAERHQAETDSPGKKVKRKWLTVPPETKSLILQLVQMTGLSISNVTLISIQIVLSVQSDLDSWDAETMANVVSEFLKTTDARAEACELLLDRWQKKT